MAYRVQMHGSGEGFNPRHETMLQLWIGLELNIKNLVSRNKKAMLAYLQCKQDASHMQEKLRSCELMFRAVGYSFSLLDITY